MELTKEQKLEMISKAIDAGFNVELKRHRATYEDLDELLPIFEGLTVGNWGLDATETASFNVNYDNENVDKFSAVVFL